MHKCRWFSLNLVALSCSLGLTSTHFTFLTDFLVAMLTIHRPNLESKSVTKDRVIYWRERSICNDTSRHNRLCEPSTYELFCLGREDSQGRVLMEF